MRNSENRSGRVLTGLAIAAVLILGGCGDDDGDADQGGSTSSPTSQSTSEQSTSQSSSSTTGTSTTGTSTTEPAGLTVEVSFSVGDGSDCGEVQAFDRTITDEVDPYRATFQQLLAGPTEAENESGVGSFFSSETADMVKSAVFTDGLLIVDFADLRPLLPNASTSCGSQALLAQLNGTAFQFEPVERTRYLIEGSCQDFANWLQRGCFETDRTGRELDPPTNERASGSGCTPASADTLPAGRWFGFVESVEPEQLAFDLACWFTGAAAEAAATEDGEESPPPNDFHIRNASDRLRTHSVDSATEVEWLPDPGDPGSVEIVPYATWVTERATRTFNPGVWLTVEDDGQVMKIAEQYVP